MTQTDLLAHWSWIFPTILLILIGGAFVAGILRNRSDDVKLDRAEFDKAINDWADSMGSNVTVAHTSMDDKDLLEVIAGVKPTPGSDAESSSDEDPGWLPATDPAAVHLKPDDWDGNFLARSGWCGTKATGSDMMTVTIDWSLVTCRHCHKKRSLENQ